MVKQKGNSQHVEGTIHFMIVHSITAGQSSESGFRIQTWIYVIEHTLNTN